MMSSIFSLAEDRRKEAAEELRVKRGQDEDSFQGLFAECNPFISVCDQAGLAGWLRRAEVSVPVTAVPLPFPPLPQ